MQHGFIKVAAGTPSIRVGDCAYNASSIINLIQKAAEQDVAALTLPELCITGATCGDLFLHDALLNAAEEALMQIALSSSAWDMLLVVGVPLRHMGKLYNCAAVIQAGRILGVVPKTMLPNHGTFYELRHFVPAPDAQSTITISEIAVPFGARQVFHCANIANLCIGVELSSDLSAPVPPSSWLAQAGATIILNAAATSETVDEADYRRMLVLSQSVRSCCAYVYANAGWGESTTDLVFAGHDIIAENGALLSESLPFSGDNTLITCDVDVQRLAYERRRQNIFAQGAFPQKTFEYVEFTMLPRNTKLNRAFAMLPFVPTNIEERASHCEQALRIQANGLRKRITHTGGRAVVVGVSGGLDSTLALLVCSRAAQDMGAQVVAVQAVTMPCFGTTSRTLKNAERLCAMLNIPCNQVDITAAVRLHFADIGHSEDQHDAVYENAQARERTQVLMDIANQLGGFVVGTGDLSELALGFATYNGDHMSMYGVNASIPKTLMRYMVEHVANTTLSGELKAVLFDILDTPVSPELLPSTGPKMSQQTENLVGPYELHDFFLYHFIRYGSPPDKVLRLACYVFAGKYPRDTIEKWLRVFCTRFFSQQFKRSCMPDGPKVGPVSLSPRGDWRMPSDMSDAAFQF